MQKDDYFLNPNIKELIKEYVILDKKFDEILLRIKEGKMANDNSFLHKSDIETIIKVNNKAIELQGEVSEQYEEMLAVNEQNAKKLERLEEDIAEIKNEIKEISRNQFKIFILLSSGFVSLIIQLISVFKK